MKNTSLVKELLSLFRKTGNRIKQDGIKSIFSSIIYFYYEFYYRVRFNIKTIKVVKLNEVGIDNENCHYHSHTDFLDFKKAMRGIEIDPKKDAFLDFGSGMGAVILMAATYPFREIAGVEISREFNSVAQDLINRNRGKLTCKNIKFVIADAASYIIPEQVTVIYFYNPFHGDILNSVVSNIKSSLQKAPRKMTVIVKNPVYFEKIDTISTFLKEVRRFKCFWGHDCVVYETY